LLDVNHYGWNLKTAALHFNKKHAIITQTEIVLFECSVVNHVQQCCQAFVVFVGWLYMFLLLFLITGKSSPCLEWHNILQLLEWFISCFLQRFYNSICSQCIKTG